MQNDGYFSLDIFHRKEPDSNVLGNILFEAKVIFSAN